MIDQNLLREFTLELAEDAAPLYGGRRQATIVGLAKITTDAGDYVVFELELDSGQRVDARVVATYSARSQLGQWVAAALGSQPETVEPDDLIGERVTAVITVRHHADGSQTVCTVALMPARLDELA